MCNWPSTSSGFASGEGAARGCILVLPSASVTISHRTPPPSSDRVSCTHTDADIALSLDDQQPAACILRLFNMKV